MSASVTIVDQCVRLIGALDKREWGRSAWVAAQGVELVRMISSAWQGNLTLDVQESGEKERDNYAVLRLALVARGTCFAGVYIEIDVAQHIHRLPVGLYLMNSWIEGDDPTNTAHMRHLAFSTRGDGSGAMTRRMCAGVLGALHAWEHDSYASLWNLPGAAGTSASSGEYAGSSGSWPVG